MKKCILSLLTCLLWGSFAMAQSNVDSLRKVAANEQTADSSRWDAMDLLITHYQVRVPDSARYFAEQLYTQAEARQDQGGMGRAINQLGIYHARRGNYEAARAEFERALGIFEELGDEFNVAKGYNNIGIIYYRQGDLSRALEQYQRSLESFERQGHQGRIAVMLNNIGNIYEDQGEYEKALDHFNRSLAMREELGDLQGMATVSSNIGIIHSNLGEYPQALTCYQRSLTIYDSLGNLSEAARMHVNMGFVYQSQGDYAQALNQYRLSLEGYEKLEDQRGVATGLHHIGMVYFYQDDFAKALEYGHRSLEVREEMGDQPAIARTLSNIGEVYEAKGDYEQALDYFKRSLAIKDSVGDQLGMAFSLAQIGKVTIGQGEYAAAEEYFERSLDLYESLNAREGQAIALQGMATIYEEKGNRGQARVLGVKALSLAREAGNVAVIQSSSQLLYRIYKSQNQTGQALEMHELYIQMRDSLNSEENQRATFRYEYQRKALADSLANEQDKVLAQLEYENQLGRQRQQLGFVGGAGLLLAILAVVLYHSNQRRQRTNKLLSEQKTEIEAKSNQNELLLKEIHHRVKNNLQTISSLLYLQSAHIKDAEVKRAVSAGQHRVESMALIHQKLYQRENLAAIEMKDYLSNLGRSLLNTFGYKPERIQLNIDMDELELDVDTAVPLGLIVNELITNSLKYAFPEGRTGTIRISMHRLADSRLQLTVADDGVGNLNQESGTSFGSQLIQLLTVQIGGKIEQGSEDGYWTRIVV